MVKIEMKLRNEKNYGKKWMKNGTWINEEKAAMKNNFWTEEKLEAQGKVD